MPQRTNDFQHMVFLLQQALNQTNATIVTESAMLPNRMSENDEEIDILVTTPTDVGTFRTGICCRNHKRKSSPSWIRDIGVQREQLGLDRIVAVTSSGISGPAKRIATAMGVETIHFHQIGRADWKSLVLPNTSSLITGAKTKVVELALIAQDDLPLERVGPVRSIVLPDRRKITPDQFLEEARSAAGNFALSKYDPRRWRAWEHGTIQSPPLLVRVQVTLPTGSIVSGDIDVPALGIIIHCTSIVEGVVLQRESERRYQDTEATMETGSTLGGTMRAVMTDGPLGFGWSGSLDHRPMPITRTPGAEPYGVKMVCGIEPLITSCEHITPPELDQLL